MTRKALKFRRHFGQPADYTAAQEQIDRQNREAAKRILAGASEGNNSIAVQWAKENFGKDRKERTMKQTATEKAHNREMRATARQIIKQARQLRKQPSANRAAECDELIDKLTSRMRWSGDEIEESDLAMVIDSNLRKQLVAWLHTLPRVIGCSFAGHAGTIYNGVNYDANGYDANGNHIDAVREKDDAETEHLLEQRTAR